MWVYVDESGNTGARLFDPEQPLFVTSAMITKTNFDLTRSADLAAIAAKVGVRALHANELGVARIEQIAPDLVKVIKQSDARFFMARVEKRYLSACKVFDTYFDAGENRAVPWHIYWTRPMRLTLLFRIASTILTEEIAQTVWDCVTAKTERRSLELFLEGANALLARAPELQDPRVRQIVTDALEWAIANPSAFSTHIADKVFRNGHSPNFVAFTVMLDGIERASKRWDRPIREIVHDRQSEFERTFKSWHEIYSRPELADEPAISWPGETEPLRFSKAAGSTLRIASEETSAGLQVVDVVLWLFKRTIDGRDIGREGHKLLQQVFRRGLQNDLSFDGVAHAAESQMREIMTADMPPEQLAAGAAGLRLIEQNRLRGMADFAAQARLESQKF